MKRVLVLLILLLVLFGLGCGSEKVVYKYPLEPCDTPLARRCSPDPDNPAVEACFGGYWYPVDVCLLYCKDSPRASSPWCDL